MASELLAFDAISVVALLSLIAAAGYRAFSTMNSLSVGIYRRQALWVGAISIVGFVTFSIDFLFTYILPYNTVIDFAVSFLNNAAILILFGWFDNSTLIARRSDPLLRNIIGWKRLRKPIWALLILLDVAIFGLSIANVAGGGSLASAPPPGVLLTLSIFLITPFSLGSILMPISASRSRDPVFHRHLGWLAVCVFGLLGIAVEFGTVLGSGLGTGFLDLSETVVSRQIPNVAFFCLLIVLGVGLFGSARSLAPVNRISREAD